MTELQNDRMTEWQNDRQDKNNMPPDLRSRGHKKMFLFFKELKLAEMKRVGFCVEELMSCGVLLDTEADVDQETENQCENQR